jgi:general secretion pathway protein G
MNAATTDHRELLLSTLKFRFSRFEIPSINGRRASADMNQSHARGFTLLELMIVMAIIVVLATIGISHYERTIVRSKEAALKTDLRDMREAIQNYTMDKEAAPTSLDALVTEHYIARIPPDPITGTPEWNTDNCDLLLSTDQTATGICDVHSTSDQVSPFENTPYSSW